MFILTNRKSNKKVAMHPIIIDGVFVLTVMYGHLAFAYGFCRFLSAAGVFSSKSKKEDYKVWAIELEPVDSCCRFDNIEHPRVDMELIKRLLNTEGVKLSQIDNSMLVLPNIATPYISNGKLEVSFFKGKYSVCRSKFGQDFKLNIGDYVFLQEKNDKVTIIPLIDSSILEWDNLNLATLKY